MPRELSSRLTIWFKFIFPPVWISGFGLVTGMMLFVEFMAGPRGKPPPELKWILLAVWTATSVGTLGS
jgi:hypothetical protein